MNGISFYDKGDPQNPEFNEIIDMANPQFKLGMLLAVEECLGL